MKLTQALLKKIIKEELGRIVEAQNVAEEQIGEWKVEVYMKGGTKQLAANAPSKDGGSFDRKIGIIGDKITTTSISVSVDDMKAIMQFWEQNK